MEVDGMQISQVSIEMDVEIQTLTTELFKTQHVKGDATDHVAANAMAGQQDLPALAQISIYSSLELKSIKK